MPTCPLCQSDDVGLLYPSTLPPRRDDEAGRLHCTNVGLGTHPDVHRCRACTFAFNPPAPGDYLAEYREAEDRGYLEEKASRLATYRRELDRIEPLAKGRRLLDVGCHCGFFLEQAQERGFEVAGIEPSAWAAQHAREQLGLPVWCGSLEDYEAAADFDVVTLWDVLEHLPDPVAALEAVRQLLAADGVLAFTTHNLDSRAARLLGTRYPFLMEMHTTHLNDRTIPLLLQRAGYELVARHPHRRALRLAYLAGRARRIGRWPARMLETLLEGLGLGDRLVWIGGLGLETVIARPAR